jgi:hypothetical protein
MYSNIVKTQDFSFSFYADAEVAVATCMEKDMLLTMNRISITLAQKQLSKVIRI